VAGPVEIEDIQQLRWKQAIEDPDLRAKIGGLQVGDSVNLNFGGGRGGYGAILLRTASVARGGMAAS
jgi:hypothetical protein